MRARCYRCQNAFDTDHFGTQKCPSCGAEVYLPDPSAPPAVAPPGPPPQSPYGQPGPAWGSPPPVPPQQPPWSPTPGWVPPPPAPAPIERSAPFAERGQRGFFRSLLETWKLTAVEPGRFFREVRVTEPRSAVLFGLLCATLGFWLSFVFQYFTTPIVLRTMTRLGERLGEAQGQLFGPGMVHQMTPRDLALSLALTPVLLLGAMYLLAGLLHVALVAFRGAPRGFEATLTVVGYAFGLLVLFGVPACGGLIGLVWFAVVLVVGLAAAQRCSSSKSLVSLLAVCALLCCLCCVYAAVAGSSGLPLPGAPGHSAPAAPGSGDQGSQVDL